MEEKTEEKWEEKIKIKVEPTKAFFIIIVQKVTTHFLSR